MCLFLFCEFLASRMRQSSDSVTNVPNLCLPSPGCSPLRSSADFMPCLDLRLKKRHQDTLNWFEAVCVCVCMHVSRCRLYWTSSSLCACLEDMCVTRLFRQKLGRRTMLCARCRVSSLRTASGPLLRPNHRRRLRICNLLRFCGLSLIGPATCGGLSSNRRQRWNGPGRPISHSLIDACSEDGGTHTHTHT